MISASIATKMFHEHQPVLRTCILCIYASVAGTILKCHFLEACICSCARGSQEQHSGEKSSAAVRVQVCWGWRGGT